MRFDEGPTAEAEVYVEAPPARVWEFVCDINVPARFSPEFQGATWLDGATAAEKGARFVGRQHLEPIGDWETTSLIVACDPPHLFSWEVQSGELAAATWLFELTPDGDGTRLRQFVRLGPGQSGLTMAIASMPDKEEKIIANRQRQHTANMQMTIEGIKALAEEAAP